MFVVKILLFFSDVIDVYGLLVKINGDWIVILGDLV